MALFAKKVPATVDSILAPYTKLIDSLLTHSTDRQAVMAAADEEIVRQETLRTAALIESQRAETIASNLKAAIAA